MNTPWFLLVMARDQFKKILCAFHILVRYETRLDNTYPTNIMHDLAQKCGYLLTVSMHMFKSAIYMKVRNMTKVVVLLLQGMMLSIV